MKLRETLPRLLADYILLHSAMLISLGGSLLYHIAWGRGALAEYLATLFTHYYSTTFLPLSLVFPIVLWTNGLYTRHRSDTPLRKFRAVLRAGVMSTLVFLAGNFLVFRETLMPRSAIILFCTLAIGFLTLARAAMAVLRPTAPAQPGTILIVGGAGYIGNIVSRMLLAQGRRVRVLDKLVYGDAAVRDMLSNPRFELIVGDCRNIQNVVTAVKGVDSIIHLAAIVGDPACDQDHQSALQINYAATRMLVEVAKGNGIARFVFASSCSVYGDTDRLMAESAPTSPISLYAQTKVDSEKALLAARSATFHPVILRLATVFGYSPRPRFDLVLNLLTARAHREQMITIYNGGQWRPFIHVRDAARGIISALDGTPQAVSGQIFNLGDSSMNYTLEQVAGHLAALEPGLKVEHIDNQDRRNYRVSFEKARNILGFKCSISLDDGIRELKRMLDAGEIADYTELRYHNQRYLKAAGIPRASSDLDIRIMAAFAGSDAS